MEQIRNNCNCQCMLNMMHLQQKFISLVRFFITSTSIEYFFSLTGAFFLNFSSHTIKYMKEIYTYTFDFFNYQFLVYSAIKQLIKNLGFRVNVKYWIQSKIILDLEDHSSKVLTLIINMQVNTLNCTTYHKEHTYNNNNSINLCFTIHIRGQQICAKLLLLKRRYKLDILFLLLLLVAVVCTD